MSWGEIFGEDKEEEARLKGIQNRPQRHPDLPPRPEPQAPNSQPAEPWFVGPEAEEKRNFNSKKVIKRTVSILFPILGLLVLIGVIIIIVDMVAQSYG